MCGVQVRRPHGCSLCFLVPDFQGMGDMRTGGLEGVWVSIEVVSHSPLCASLEPLVCLSLYPFPVWTADRKGRERKQSRS